MAEAVTKLGFTITADGQGCAPAARGPKHFALDVDDKKCVRIGRAPGNDIQVELRGCSQFHAEIRLLPSEEDGLPPRLVVRDLSMNGTGLKFGEDKPAVGAKKDQDVPLYHGMQILVPFQLKANQTPDDRAWLKLSFDDPEMGVLPKADGHADGDAGGGPAPGVRKPSENGDKEDKEDDDDDQKDEDKDDEEEDGEKEDGEAREAFVDLLVKTKQISVGTSYEEAERMLCKKAAWKAVDVQTRKECFEIFVDHLDDVGHKKKKKKDKGKKSKKKKHREDEDEEEAEEGPRKKKKKGEKRKGQRPKKSSVSS